MLDALGLGLLGASSLLLAGVFACWVRVPTKLVGILGGFGAGSLLAAISTDLIVEAQEFLSRYVRGVRTLDHRPNIVKRSPESRDHTDRMMLRPTRAARLARRR